MRFGLALATMLAALTTAPLALAGDPGPWVMRPHIAFRLSGGALDLEGRRQRLAVVEVRIEPGWKIYWRAPGDGGVPTEFDWRDSHNLAATMVGWPPPRRSEQAGMQSIGYQGSVTFPVTLQPVRADEPVQADLTIRYGICREICIPDEARLVAEIGTGPGVAEAVIRAALARLPLVPAPAVARIRALRRDGGLLIVAEAARPFVAPDLFLDGAGRYGLPNAAIEDGGRRVRFEVPVAGTVPAAERLTLTLVDGATAYEWSGVVPAR